MTAAISVRIPPEIEQRLEHEVARLSTTKSRYVQDLLRQALAPKDPIALLMQIRKDYGISPKKGIPQTDKSSRSKELARQAVARKYNRPLLSDDQSL
ncbi:MAG: hypothetical protein WBK51_09390 [Polaromonas sp.]